MRYAEGDSELDPIGRIGLCGLSEGVGSSRVTRNASPPPSQSLPVRMGGCE